MKQINESPDRNTKEITPFNLIFKKTQEHISRIFSSAIPDSQCIPSHKEHKGENSNGPCGVKNLGGQRTG